ncbi:RNA-directed DNA polymerase [Qipengyuania flava]|uniref:RNA-directed DNA polymerase n=1 Tax=Qipengyuania flava TaxID=192812 RepID=UPI00141A84E0|nr:RNA-directed DNA polymerase [Qipengyuania flava]NIJ60526.1 hypothetical protein [Qipengyuania flava]
MAILPNAGHGLHTPRLEERQKVLAEVFSVDRMQLCWKKYVRKGLRDQEVLDLFDYNDSHWNKDKRFSDLRSLILSGNYRPSNSIPTKIEKKHGVCRTIVTPSPEDAVVLQCIVEYSIAKSLKGQPSSNSFFSRSHQAPDVSFKFARDYIWFKQWRKFSKARFEVVSVHAWVATTDIATYFDNIRYEHLRNIISTFDETEEVVLDILFSVLDQLCWRPDYLPSARVGLPQVQFDAPRLLAHVYLYEIDRFLSEKTDDTFVRWVDDITFAHDTEETCRVILRDLDTLLQMRGIRLNSGKTHVMRASTARRFFHQRENDNLTRWNEEFDAAKKAGTSTTAIETKVETSFLKFLAREPFGHHDKIIKRFVGFAAKAKNAFAMDNVLEGLSSNPSMRGYAYWYLSALGPSEKALAAIEKYLKSPAALDDASQCQLARLLTEWKVDPGTALFKKLSTLADAMGSQNYVGTQTFRFVAALWMLTKYESQSRIAKFIHDSVEIWEHNEFLSRQVAAASGKFRDPDLIAEFSSSVRAHGLRSSISVLDSLDVLRSLEKSVPPAVRLYILNGKNRTTYSLQRFLIAFTVLSSSKLAASTRKALRLDLLKYLADPHYRAVINSLKI